MNNESILKEFLRLIEKEKFFEAHEYLEHFWIDAEKETKNIYRALIQLAVAKHHQKQNNSIGKKTCQERAQINLEEISKTCSSLLKLPIIQTILEKLR